MNIRNIASLVWDWTSDWVQPLVFMLWWLIRFSVKASAVLAVTVIAIDCTTRETLLHRIVVENSYWITPLSTLILGVMAGWWFFTGYGKRSMPSKRYTYMIRSSYPNKEGIHITLEQVPSGKIVTYYIPKDNLKLWFGQGCHVVPKDNTEIVWRKDSCWLEHQATFWGCYRYQVEHFAPRDRS